MGISVTVGPWRRRSSTVDINVVFVVVNYVLFCATVLFYGSLGYPRLVDSTTLIIYALFVIQVRWMLLCERRRRSPFLLVLVFVLTLFHFPRILTLYWVDQITATGALERLRPSTVGDINNALAFTLVANLAITIGVVLAQRGRNVTDVPPAQRLSYGAKLQWLLLVTVCYGVYASVIVPTRSGALPLWASYLGVLLNFVIVAPIAVIFLAQQGAGRPRGKGWLPVVGVVALTAVLVLLQAALGSRSAFLTFAQIAFFVFLASGAYRIPTKMVVAAGLLLAASIPLFTVSTYSRSIRRAQGAELTLGLQRDWLLEAVSARLISAEAIDLLRPAFDRAAFLDFTTDLIKNKREYREIISLPFYAMSVVDNVTPGFDVFGVARASNALRYIYDAQAGSISRTAEAYQSDQFNVYGEYYVLFGGWASIPIFVLAAYLLQRAYGFIRAKSPLAAVVWRYFAIGVFFNWVTSFGMDWQVITGLRDALVFALVVMVLDRRWTWFRTARPLPVLLGST